MSEFAEKVFLLVIGASVTAFLGLIVWGLKALITAVIDNTKAVIKLSGRLEEIAKVTDLVPKLKTDIHAFHAKLREHGVDVELASATDDCSTPKT